MPEAPAKNIKDNTVTDYWLERGDYLHIDYLAKWVIPLIWIPIG